MDKPTNKVFLPVRNTFIKWFNITPKPIFPPLKMEYWDDFRIMSAEELDSKWLRSMPWGQYHPGSPHQWFDPQAVTIDSGGVHLGITQNKLETNGIEIGLGIGMLHSKRSFGYGLYQWNVILPKGAQLWPAVWTAGGKSWPPEVDVVEAYSDDEGKVGKRVETNIHCGNVGGNHYALGTGKHGRLFDHGQRLNLKLHWEKDFIRIYYNNLLVRVLTDKRHLSWFNLIPEQVVIIGNGTRPDATKLPFEKLAVSPYTVEDFAYYST